MKILRIISAALVLLLLAACAAPVEPGYEDEQTTTTQATASGEANGIVWREIDLQDDEHAQLREWLEAYEQEWTPPNLRLNYTQRLVVRGGPFDFQQIWLLDDNTGEETLLIDAADVEGDADMVGVHAVLNERFFVYYIAVEGTCAVSSGLIFDLERMMHVPVETGIEGVWPSFQFMYNDVLYFIGDRRTGIGPGPGGQLEVFTLPLQALAGDTPVQLGESLVAGLPEADWGERQVGWQFFSPDRRYYVVGSCGCCNEGALALYFFDLYERAFVGRVNLDFQGALDFRDDRTLILHNEFWDQETDGIFTRVIEITLP